MHSIGTPFYELITVDSTNNYAMAKVHEGLASHGTAIFAHDQTAGKGQRGKQWLTQPGTNIMMTVIVNAEQLQSLPPFALSAAVALAVHDFFSHYAKDETSVKWPNDLYWRDRKAGGILIENIYRGSDWQWAIIGMGININQTIFPNAMSRAVSLRQITGRQFDTLALAHELCTKLEYRWQQLTNGTTTNFIFNDYQTCLFKKGQTVRLKKENIIFNAEVRGINTSGQLIVWNGVEQAFSVGEVEWIFS